MSISHPRRRLSGAVIAAGLVVLFAAGACGAGESNKSSSGPAADNKAAAPAQDGNAQAGAGGAPDKVPVPGQAPVNLPDTRSIIYTGTITVQVTKVDDAATKAAGFAVAAGGFVGGDERKSDSGGSSAQLTLRVPAAKFSDVVNQLHGLGKELVRALSSQDVTADVADVNARLANAEASVNRVRTLMDKAQTITDITTLESELSRRESDLESLQARQRALTDQTSLSTITVSFYGPDAPVVVTTHKTKTGFIAGLSAGWDAFVVFLVVVLTVLGALLPWLVLIGLVGVLPWMVYRRRRQARLALAPAGLPPVDMAPVPVRAAPAPHAGPVSAPPRGPAPVPPARPWSPVPPAGPGSVPPRAPVSAPPGDPGSVPPSAPVSGPPSGPVSGPPVGSGRAPQAPTPQQVNPAGPTAPAPTWSAPGHATHPRQASEPPPPSDEPTD